MKYFYHHDFFNLKSGNGLYIIHKFKIYQQKLMYTCAPASVLMILKHLDKNTKYTEKGLAKIFKTRPYPYGTELVDIINGLKSLGYKTFSNFDMKANRDGLVFKNFLNFKKFASTLWCNSPIRNNSLCILRHSFGERWEQMWKILLPKRYWYVIPRLLFPVFLFKRITGLCNFKGDLS